MWHAVHVHAIDVRRLLTDGRGSDVWAEPEFLADVWADALAHFLEPEVAASSAASWTEREREEELEEERMELLLTSNERPRRLAMRRQRR